MVKVRISPDGGRYHLDPRRAEINFAEVDMHFRMAEALLALENAITKYELALQAMYLEAKKEAK